MSVIKTKIFVKKVICPQNEKHKICRISFTTLVILNVFRLDSS